MFSTIMVNSPKKSSTSGLANPLPYFPAARLPSLVATPRLSRFDFQVVEGLFEHPFINFVLHEVFSIDVNHRNVILVLLPPLAVADLIYILFLVNELHGAI